MSFCTVSTTCARSSIQRNDDALRLPSIPILTVQRDSCEQYSMCMYCDREVSACVSNGDEGYAVEIARSALLGCLYFREKMIPQEGE